MRVIPVFFGVAVMVALASGCRPGSSGASTDAAPGAIDASPAASSSALAASGAAGSLGTPDAGALGCALDRGFKGTIGPKLEVLMRLERTGDGVAGHYLYTHVGADLALRGTLPASGALALVEGDPQSPTGRFTGSCEADGHLRGLWTRSQDRSPLSFDLAPVTPRDEVVVATRKKTRRFPPRPATRADAGGGGFGFEPKQACLDEVSWPEIFGSPTADAEAAINRALTSDAWVFTGPSDAQLRACVVGERVTGARTFEVLLNARGFFAVRETESERYEGGTHPWDPGPESWLAFDTRSGAALTKRALLPSAPPGEAALAKLLDRCIVALVKDAYGGEPGALADMRERVSPNNLALLVLPTEKGLRFGATGYAPPARVLEGAGPTLSWASLLAAGALPTDSPAARLWAGVTPAKPGDDPCIATPPPK